MTKTSAPRGHKWRCHLCTDGFGIEPHAHIAFRELQRHYQAHHAPKRGEPT
jgi:hypothetical protein